MKPGVFIIAEAGVNHNGSLDIARQLVDVAADAGADAVKFQTFKASSLVRRDAKKADYQRKTSSAAESQYDMIARLELDLAAHEALVVHCRERGIQFLSTPFDHGSIELLDRLGLKVFKIPSGEVTNLPYLRHIGRLGREVVLSTGMANLGEVEAALAVLVQAGTPLERITVLHATTEYPCPMDEVNLLAMQTIRGAFGVKVGYSDHTQGIEVAVAAAALGASIIEKHFTLDRNMEGPDHKASLEPGELRALVQAVRNVSRALGDGLKRASPSELKNMPHSRKSIVAATAIRAGERFTDQNLAVKRPMDGISPMRWDDVVGTVATRDYLPDDAL